jgi:hypothetical protein
MTAIHSRRLFSSSGVFRETAKKLKINLEETAEEENKESVSENGTKYMLWSQGRYKISSNNAINEEYGKLQTERHINKKESVI